jgi:hypothetical protein
MSASLPPVRRRCPVLGRVAALAQLRERGRGAAGCHAGEPGAKVSVDTRADPSGARPPVTNNTWQGLERTYDLADSLTLRPCISVKLPQACPRLGWLKSGKLEI